MRKKRKRGKPSDPMVPIFSPNLRAAIADRQITVADLARKLRTNPQTVAYLAAGDDIKRSRASRRALMAKILRVDEQFLGTNTSSAPLLIPGGVNAFASPRTQLALGRLIRTCIAFTDRDLKDATLKDVGVKETATPEAVFQQVAYCLVKLTDIDEQRAEQLVGAERPVWGVSNSVGMFRSRHLPLDEDEEAAGVGLITAWEQILEPWFSGKAKMNYRRLSERAGFPVPAGERRSDTNPFIIVSPKGA